MKRHLIFVDKETNEVIDRLESNQIVETPNMGDLVVIKDVSYSVFIKMYEYAEKEIRIKFSLIRTE